jgi:hypothetical protein
MERETSYGVGKEELGQAMIGGGVFRWGILFVWAVVVIIGVLSPGVGRNYELLGTHWLSWMIAAVLLTAAYFFVRDQRRTLSFAAAVVALVLISADMVATTAVVMALSAATQRRSQPISGVLTVTSCGVTIALAMAIFSVAVGSGTWLYRRMQARRETK